LLERYLREVRPMFSGANGHDRLWQERKAARSRTRRSIASSRRALAKPLGSQSTLTSSGIVLQRRLRSSSPAASGSRAISSATPRSPQPMNTTIRPARSRRAGSMPESSPDLPPEHRGDHELCELRPRQRESRRREVDNPSLWLPSATRPELTGGAFL
jgi:hypothetical protein